MTKPITPLLNPFVQLEHDLRVELALQALMETCPHHCFLCGRAALTSSETDFIPKVEFFKSFLYQFGVRNLPKTFDQEKTCCAKCCTIIGQVWSLHEEIEKIKTTISEILKTCLDEIIATKKNEPPKGPRRDYQVHGDDSVKIMDMPFLSPNNKYVTYPEENLASEMPVLSLELKVEEEAIEIKMEPIIDYDDDYLHDGDPFIYYPEIQEDSPPETIELINDSFFPIIQSSHSMSTTSVTSCCSCGKFFATRRKLAIHEMTTCQIPWDENDLLKIGIKLKRCEFSGCGNVFLLKKELDRHKRSHAPPKVIPQAHPDTNNVETWNCSACGKVFFDLYNRNFHQERVHLLPPAPKIVPQKKAKRKWTPKKTFTCCTCGKVFYRWLTLQTHQEVHGVKFPCSVCGKELFSKKACARHEVIVCKVKTPKKKLDELGLKIRKCGVEGCSKVFGSARDLKRHARNVHITD